eukprot:TRINITY_DN12708_c0_g1_i1.p1 TRINITY_DN12708_c0_g1~~TRINITY_DN12708_c0_g1_i1.p1  ORF type:complete len:243 (-),score=26.14 TRINITY_DN12708_c0_g1_i1:38-766(-)
MRSYLVLSLFFASVVAHSWLHCADYRISSKEDEITFNKDNCKGYGRNWKRSNPGGAFGADTGYDFGTSTPSCRDQLPQPYDSGYDASWPMAVYSPGQNVCLAWPAKNHVAASCNNPNIPDNGLNIYVTGANPTTNPAGNSVRLVKAFPKRPNAAANGGDPNAGFQYCPRFCQDNDKATCTGCFTVPSDLEPGSTYTFVWAWAFNGPNQLYSNCWEASIVPGASSSSTVIASMTLTIIALAFF